MDLRPYGPMGWYQNPYNQNPYNHNPYSLESQRTQLKSLWTLAVTLSFALIISESVLLVVVLVKCPCLED